MKFVFPRYIHGMLQTSDMRNVFGDLQPVAYSPGFSEQLQRDIYEKVKPELNRELLKETGEAYGFFGLNENDYVAAHYQLMGLTELTPRGKPVFSEYLHVTAKQISDLEWNLSPIFSAFSKIDYYDQVVKDLPPTQTEIIKDTEWLNYLRHYPLHVEAVLLRFLASFEKINIVSAPNEPGLRWQFLCSLLLCVPERYRKNISFATLASDTTKSVRLFFSSQQGGYGQIIDWTAPTVPDLSGIVYANWVANLLGEARAESIKSEISNLRLPMIEKSTELRTYGEELDLAIKHKEWFENNREHLKIKVPEQLEQLLNKINEFSCVYSDQEIGDWLWLIVLYVMKLRAYDVGVNALSSYSSLLTHKDIREKLVQKIVTKAISSNKENLNTLADFLSQITHYAERTNQDLLIDFCKEILLLSLGSQDYKKGLILWEKIIHV